jgi:hypothetical protein
MARKILLETHYSFTPSTRTVVIPRYIPRERLLLITNVTTNQVIYNFSDPSLKATSYVATIDASNNGTTTVVLNYNTTAMTLSDKLQFTIDEYTERILPGEALQDPVQKMRVSQPQSLIDTDFEYGTQPTKWEVLSLVNNKPCQYYDIQSPIAQPSGGDRTITALTGTGSSRLVTVVTSTAHGLVLGDKFFIQDTLDPYANGWFMVKAVSTTTVTNDTFTYYARANITTNGSILDATKTFIYKASDYTSSPIPVSATAGAAFTNSGTTVTTTTTNAHGLVAGDLIYVKGTTSTTNPPNGAWEVATTPTVNTFTFSVVDTPTGTITALASSLTPRAGSQSIHRAFDGGVKFTTGVSAPGSRVVRQTRKYFRYQSGKGIQFSTGSMMKPVLAVDSITSSSNVVTVNVHYEHFLGVGATITVTGSTDPAYNGTWTVASVPTPLSFTYVASSVPASTPAPGWPINVAPSNWYGAQVRIGMFDDQNGMFFEYDGQNFSAVRRDSTEQISGNISTTQGSQAISGSGTAFSTQLTPGDKIVIRGTTYSVESIVSDTSLYVFPEYRGPSIASGGIASKVTDFKVPQSQFNIDRLDGTGPSGMTINLSKMQMFYIDYAWYGAGAIRFGVKDEFGEVIYVHRMTHANIKNAAYMRSGNLPARYEAANDTPRTVLTATASSSAASISVASTADFPSAGTLFLAQSGVTGSVIEYVSYTGKTSTTFTGLTRGLTNVVINPNTGAVGGGSAATTFTYSSTAPISVRLYSRHVATGTSHWGSAVIMDGRFDEDKAYIFQTGMATSLAVPRGSSTNRYGLLSLRVAPSVDNGMVGIFGQRELINRMQLTLKQMDVLAQSTASAANNPGIFLIEVILNGKVNTTTGNSWVNVGGSSLSQVQYHAANTIITGGEPILSYFISTVTGEANVVSQDLSTVRELGNSILAGGTTTTSSVDGTNIFPDGPDMVTITVRNLSGAAVTSASLNGRLSWTEAQA